MPPSKKSNKSNKSKKSNYEKCKTNIIGQDMRLFKQGRLKQRNKQPVKSRKQAIAIALSMAEQKCKDKKTRGDVRKENIKIRQTLSRENDKAPLNPAHVRTIITKLKDLKKQQRSREYRTLKINLLSRVIMSSPVSPEIARYIQRYLRQS
jgi:hypothetical protein